MAAVEEVTSDAVLFDSDGNILSSGTTLSGATIAMGGNMIVADKGTAEETTVSSGGKMYISSGGVANNTTVNNWGSMYVEVGGVAYRALQNYVAQRKAGKDPTYIASENGVKEDTDFWK